MHKVFVKGLKVNCIIGIYPEERVKEQELVIDLELDCPSLEQAGREKRLELSVDYAALSARVKEYVIARKAELLEELAAGLYDLIEQEFHTPAVTIRLTKTEAVPGTAGTGIEFCKKA